MKTKVTSIGSNCLADVIIKKLLPEQYERIASPVSNVSNFTIDKFDTLLTSEDLLNSEIIKKTYIDYDGTEKEYFTVKKLNFDVIHNKVDEIFRINNRNRLLTLQENKDDCWFIYASNGFEKPITLTPLLKKYLNKIIIIDLFGNENIFKDFNYYIKYDYEDAVHWYAERPEKERMYFDITEKVKEILELNMPKKTYDLKDLF